MTVTKPMTVTVQDTDGTPKEGLKVYAFDGTTYTNFNGTSDVNGEAVFTLPQGDYRFRADLNGTQFWSEESNHCTLPGCESATVTVTKPVTVTVSGGGQPYPNLKVYAFNGDTYTGFNGTADANGQVIFTLPQGSYRFRADYDGVQFWSSAENSCTLPGCTSDEVVLPGGTGETTVTIDYSYDALRRLTGATFSDGRSFGYTYDPAGNVLELQKNLGPGTVMIAYGYDAANQLNSAQQGTVTTQYTTRTAA